MTIIDYNLVSQSLKVMKKFVLIYVKYMIIV